MPSRLGKSDTNLGTQIYRGKKKQFKEGRINYGHNITCANHEYQINQHYFLFSFLSLRRSFSYTVQKR